MDAGNSATPVTSITLKPPAVPAWPRSAQVATVFLLGVATTLLAVHGWRGLRWASRPTELERGGLPVYRIDLNRADRAELLQVPGLGPQMAQRIQDHRSEHGAFQSVGDLRQVQGIGPARLETLRRWVDVFPPGLQETEAAASSVDSSGRKSTSKKNVQITEPIDVNRATLTELQRLPGVGPKRAELIINERQKRPFKSVDELRRVPGIGPKTLEKLRPYITTGHDPLRIATTGGVGDP
jgi:competence protein ComEA